MIVVDLYAGVGVAQACRRMGAREVGVENAESAIALREANGFETVFEDVWDAEKLAPFLMSNLRPGEWWTKHSSPPCQLWSAAGKGSARAHREAITAAMHEGVYEDLDTLREFGRSLGDENYVHVLIPLHYVSRYRPDFVSLEQVPPVLSLWQAMIPELEKMGYSAKAANLMAEQFGVPQTRKRAILVACKKELGEVALPTPTHSRYYSRTPEKLDPGVEKWVSMAEALAPLGWGPDDGLEYAGAGATSIDTSGQRRRQMGEPAHTMTGKGTAVRVWPDSRPAPTVTGGGAASGGAEPFGPGGRRAIRNALELHRRRHGAARGAGDA